MNNALELTVPEGLPFIDFRREFDFPVAAVFRAHAEPDLVKQWLGPRGLRMDIDRWDFRSGGSYSYVHTGPDGVPHRFSGVFHTVRLNDFAIQTFEFGGHPDVVSIEFMTFQDLGDGRCRLTGHAVYPSMEAGARRHGVLGDGRRNDGGVRAAR